MKKITIVFFYFISLSTFSQIQVGLDIDGNNEGDQLGWSTAITKDGSILAVGASGVTDRTGYVKVLKNINGTWVQQGSDIVGDNASDLFGHSIALSDDGTIVAIGGYGYDDGAGIVKIYKYSNNNWTQLGTTITGHVIVQGAVAGNPEVNFGYSVSLNSDGTILAVGALKSDSIIHNNPDIFNHGDVAIFNYENNDWVKTAQISGEAEEDNSGISVSLNSDGTIVAIGAANNDGNGNNSGHVRVYRKQNSSWIQTGNDSYTNGKDINGENAYDLSGFSVSLSKNGSYVAIGAPANDGNDGNIIDSGHVRVYGNLGDLSDNSYNTSPWESFWTDEDGQSTLDQFGYSVSLSESGKYLAVGAIDNGANGSKSGQVRLYKLQTRRYDMGEPINGEASGDQAGFSVSISGDGTKVAVGAPFNDGNGSNSGHVRVYDLSEVLSTETNSISNFNIYPNPATQQITLDLENSILKEVSIYNNLGQKVKRSKSKTINTSQLTSGIYFVTVETEQGKSTKKLIIN